MRSFYALLFCVLVVSGQAETTPAPVETTAAPTEAVTTAAATTAAATTAAATTAAATTAAATTAAATEQQTPLYLFNFAGAAATCTAALVKAEVNDATCNSFIDAELGGTDISAVCDATAAAAATTATTAAATTAAARRALQETTAAPTEAATTAAATEAATTAAATTAAATTAAATAAATTAAATAATTCTVGKVRAAFVAKGCPVNFTNVVNNICKKEGAAYLAMTMPQEVMTVYETVKTAITANTATAPTLACNEKVKFALQIMPNLVLGTLTTAVALMEGVCSTVGTTSCWSNYYTHLKNKSSPSTLVAAVVDKANCKTCAMESAVLFAKHYPALTDAAKAMMAAVVDSASVTCVSTKAGASCIASQELNVNIAKVAAKFPAFTQFTGIYDAPSDAAAAAATTAAARRALQETTAAPTEAATTAAATEAATTAAATAAATTAAATTAAATAAATTAAATAAATTAAATTATTAAATAYPWTSVLTSVTNKDTGCAAIAEWNKLGCCGAHVGRVSSLLAVADDATTNSKASGVMAKLYPVAEAACSGLTMDLFCTEGAVSATVKSVTVTFEVNGVDCAKKTNALIAALGEGMLNSFVASGIVPDAASGDVSICDLSFRTAKAATLTFSRRRLAAASASLTVKAEESQLTAISAAKTDATALTTLNTALAAAVTAGAATAKVAAAADFAAAVDMSTFGAAPLTAASIGTVQAAPAVTASSTLTSTNVVSAAPAAFGAVIAPVCAIGAMFAAAV